MDGSDEMGEEHWPEEEEAGRTRGKQDTEVGEARVLREKKRGVCNTAPFDRQ